MAGASIDQKIWVTYCGAVMSISLGDLYKEYVKGELDKYRVYYADPQSIEDSREDDIKKPLVGTMAITDMSNNGTHQKITVTSEDGLSVEVGATGRLLDYVGIDPPHLAANLATETRHYVTALTGLGGPPGDRIYVRNVTKRYMSGSCNVISVPTPNMIAESGFVIMS